MIVLEAWLRRFVLAPLCALLSLSPVFGQQIVYDNTLTFLKTYASESREFGDELELVGTARTLTDISFEYFGKFEQQGDEMAKVRIYSNEKPYDNYSKEPTRVLYESPFFSIEPGYNARRLPGLGAQLEDVVTFTIEVRGIAEGEKVGLLLYSPVNIGLSYNDFWRRNEANSWERITYSRDDLTMKANAAVQLKAIETSRLQSLKVSTNNMVQFDVRGLSLATFTLETSSDLQTWTPVTLYNVTSTNMTVNRAAPAGQVKQFYRIRQP